LKKLQTEAPVNGGRNYRIDHCSSENKSGYMLGTPVYLTVLAIGNLCSEEGGSDNL